MKLILKIFVGISIILTSIPWYVVVEALLTGEIELNSRWAKPTVVPVKLMPEFFYTVVFIYFASGIFFLYLGKIALDELKKMKR